MMSLRDAKRRAVRLSGRSSRVRSAGATQCDTLASAATAIGAIANKLPSASAPVTKTEQIPCRMRGSATPIGTCAERPRFASITDCCRQSSLGPQRGRRKLTSNRWNSAIPGLLEVTGAIEGFSSVGVAVWTGGEVSFGACTEVEIR